jgi:hypothetical protein
VTELGQREELASNVWTEEEGPEPADGAVRACPGLQARGERPRLRARVARDRRGSLAAHLQCYSEDRWERRVDTRTRNDPLDPTTFRHAGECEHRDTTDPVLIKAILRARDNPGWDYWFVECSICGAGWQVPYYVAESGG